MDFRPQDSRLIIFPAKKKPNLENCRPLTPEEERKYVGEDFVLYEKYPADRFPVRGRFLTHDDL